MEDRRTGARSSDSVPPGDDVPGADLARSDLPEPGRYQIDPSETEAEELTDERPTSDAEVEIDDADQLEAAEEAAREDDVLTPAHQLRAARPVRKSGTGVVAVTDVAAPAKRAAAAAEPRTGPGTFVGQSVNELKKVVWPNAAQVRQYFIVVLVFVLFVIAYVVLLDTGLGALLLRLFG